MTRREGRFKASALRFAAALAISAWTALLRGWVFMLAVQVAHQHWVPQLPTIGYWWAALICFLFPIAASSRKDES